MSFDAIPNLLADLIEEQKKTREAVIQLAEALAGVRAKAEKAKAEKPAPAPAPAAIGREADAPKAEAPKAEKPAPAPAAAVTDYAPVGAAITAFAAANGREAAVAKLATFGVKSGKELKPDQYAAALAAFSAAEAVA